MMHGMQGMAMDLNDIAYDAFLANDRTLADPEVVRVEPSGRVRLRVINGASSSQFWLDLGALGGRVVAVDGHAVHPVAGSRFPIAIAQRLDILVDLPVPAPSRSWPGSRAHAPAPGSSWRRRGAPIARIGETGRDQAPPVDNSLETRLSAAEPLRSRKADLVTRSSWRAGWNPIDGR